MFYSYVSLVEGILALTWVQVLAEPGSQKWMSLSMQWHLLRLQLSVFYLAILLSVQAVVLQVSRDSDDVHTQVSLGIKGKRRPKIQWLGGSSTQSHPLCYWIPPRWSQICGFIPYISLWFLRGDEYALGGWDSMTVWWILNHENSPFIFIFPSNRNFSW